MSSTYKIKNNMKDYEMDEFLTNKTFHKKKQKEVKDGLISRLMMDNTDEIQKSLRQQINEIQRKAKA